MRRPGYENKLNWNTALIVAGLVTGAVGWGMQWQSHKADIKANADSIERIEAKQREIEAEVRGYSGVEFRVGALEVRMSSVRSSQRDTDQTVSQLASDIRVIKQIVERLDQSLNSDRRSPAGSFPR